MAKSDLADKGYLSAIQYLVPHKAAGLGTNLCPAASPGCIAACLFTAGRGVFKKVHAARQYRTELFVNNRAEYIKLLYKELEKFNDSCHNKGEAACVRLNGTSDIQWEKVIPSLFDDFPDIQFYDYTKIHKRMLRFCNGELPENYHLTFSRSESNEDKCLEVLDAGGNVAIVWNNPAKKWNGYKTFDMDKTDLRFLDPINAVGYLTAKGKARKDTTGFVVK